VRDIEPGDCRRAGQASRHNVTTSGGPRRALTGKGTSLDLLRPPFNQRRTLMRTKWMIPAVLAVLVVGLAMSRRQAPEGKGTFLAPLSVGMDVSLTQDQGGAAFLYIPSAAEAEGGGFWKLTELGPDYLECRSGTAVWRVPAGSIARISWNEEG
jgi:hypothetical protein